MIGYYVHHQGAGHLQRLQTVAAHLQTPVTGLSSLAAPNDWPGHWVGLDHDDRPAPLPNADIDAHGRLHWAPLNHEGYRARMAAIAAWLGTARPHLMVVDVSVEVAVLARTLGVPVAVVAMRGDRRDAGHELAYDLATRLLAPWPADLAEPGWPDRWTAKTFHSGAFSRFDEIAARPAAIPNDIVPESVTCLLGSGGSGLSVRDADAIAEATPTWTWTFCGADFGPSREPLPDLLARSQVVVTHAGQNAVAEVAALRRPAVVVAQDRPHGEQRATAQALDCGGIAVTCNGWPPVTEWPSLLDQALERGGSRWGSWNDRAAAPRFAAELDRLARQ
ncbi:MAG: glycosyl transferase [Actinomycetota bacterium]|nr:glycosyl transferase [Actinomycetota bacterium]